MVHLRGGSNLETFWSTYSYTEAPHDAWLGVTVNGIEVSLLLLGAQWQDIGLSPARVSKVANPHGSTRPDPSAREDLARGSRRNGADVRDENRFLLSFLAGADRLYRHLGPLVKR